MRSGPRRLGPATLYIRQCDALPESMRDGTRELVSLEVAPVMRGKGHATELMHKVCREADLNGTVLLIWPDPYGEHDGPDRERLIRWYARDFGFVVTQNNPVLMARKPMQQRRTRLHPIVEALRA